MSRASRVPEQKEDRRFPMQPIIVAKDGVIRFKPNAIVQHLLDKGPFTMNDLYAFPKADQEQFAQLIGYSVSGFGDLSYASKRRIEEADELAARIAAKHKRWS